MEGQGQSVFKKDEQDSVSQNSQEEEWQAGFPGNM